MTPLHLPHRHICLAVLSAALGMSLQAQTHQVTIRPDKVIAHINPLFYGSGMEDVNHEVYGGIYAQQIFGESLEEAPVVNGISHFHSYGDPWRQADGNLYSYAGKAAKLIYDNAVAENCTAEVSFRYDGLTGEAGLMTHVTDITADFFTGYSFVASAWSNNVLDSLAVAARYDSVQSVWEEQVDTLTLQADTTYTIRRNSSTSSVATFTPRQTLTGPYILVTNGTVLASDTLHFSK